VSADPFASLNLADHVGDDPQAVARNRAAVAAGLGLPSDRVAVMRAAHGRDVAIVSQGGTVADVDGLVTTARGLGLLALAADCATVALADPVAGVVGAVHSGWRGVAANAVGAVVAAMAEQGSAPGRIEAAIGPVICPGCYEVSEAVCDEVAAAAGSARARTRWGSTAVDLQAGIAEQLQVAGVAVVSADPDCTAETADLYSFRRDGRTGRHGMLIAMAAEPGRA
jgi:hypothetical protein